MIPKFKSFGYSYHKPMFSFNDFDILPMKHFL